MKQSLQKASYFILDMNSFKMKKIFIFIFLNLFCFTCISQNNQVSVAKSNSGEKINETNQQQVEKKTFNLPPGVVMLPKTDTNIDYSYKLSLLPKDEPKNIVELDFFKDISTEKLEYMEKKAPKDYQYFVYAKEYYNALSKKVKVTFTVEELWYIYYFDQKLKNTLQTIK